jgi:hypothetical protein
MASLHQEALIIKISKMLRDGESQEIILSDDVKTAITMMLEELVTSLAGDKVLIEVTKAE